MTTELPDTFDPALNKHEMGPLEPGTYICEIGAIGLKANKAGTGKLIEVRYKVVDGPGKGRFIFDLMNYMNPNEQAQIIGRGQLAQLAEACKIVGQIKDLAVFHGKLCRVTVKVKTSVGYQPQNEVVVRSALDAPASGDSKTPF
jgi:hypothetical protein